MTLKFADRRHCHIFSRCFVSIFKFSYWYKFHVNVVTGSEVMTIYVYKGLTRNPEIGNTPVWVFSSIWRLVQVMNAKFRTNVSNKMLLNAAKCQIYSFYPFWVIKRKPTGGRNGREGGWRVKLPHPPLLLSLPRLGLRRFENWLRIKLTVTANL